MCLCREVAVKVGAAGVQLYGMYLEIRTHYHVLFCRGPTFRTAFQKLGGLRAIMKATTMALPASAPPAFEREIVNSLALDNTSRIDAGYRQDPLTQMGVLLITRKTWLLIQANPENTHGQVDLWVCSCQGGNR